VTSHGDLYHRVSVFDLKPGVKCYYRMELCRTEAATPVASFTTPAAETWRPARRRLHVAMTGSDANDGLTPARAFRTITKAGEEARAGDTVVVAQGVYRETFVPVATGVEGAPIVFQSETPNGAVLDGSNYHRPSGVALIRKGHVVIDGFVLRSFAHVLGTRAGYDYAQVLVWDSRNVTVRNCVQYGYGKYGLAAQVRGSRDVGWRNNAVIGFANGLVFHATGDNMRVVQNTFYVPQIRHIIVHDCEGFVMRNNLFFGKHEQKYKVACIAIENARKKEMDCNAFVFNANDSCRYVGGRGDDPDAQSLGLGLEGWRQAMKGDPHSVELGADAVRFAAPGINAYDPAFDAFWGPYTRGEKTPTLGLFDLPRGHVLDSAGEGGGVIGARPVAGQSASGTGRP
jgi:hypothetical protein